MLLIDCTFWFSLIACSDNILNDYEDFSPTNSEPDHSIFDGVLTGDEWMDISHAGGEFHDVKQTVGVNTSTHSGIPWYVWEPFCYKTLIML